MHQMLRFFVHLVFSCYIQTIGAVWLKLFQILRDNSEKCDYRRTTHMKNYNKYLRKCILSTVLVCTLVLGMTVSNVPNIVTNGTAVTVEAASKKKDKKKPKITFKGKTKLTAYKNKSVKIPKTTAKDNKDGNVTKKIKVTVKKGKKSYKSIANKIKNNKSVKFTSTGKYVITYTVTDKAGNKATKKRYVTVKNQPKKETTTEVTTEETTTETQTTETPTTEQPSTEKPTESTTQENPKPETPTEEEIPAITASSLLSDKYTISTDADFHEAVIEVPTSSDNVTINIENDRNLIFDPRDNLTEKSIFLDYLGKITATDAEGNDNSDNIIIDEYNLVGKTYGQDAVIYIYVNDGKGNEVIHKEIMSLQLLNANSTYPGYELISTDPIVFGEIYTNTVGTVTNSSSSKSLVLTNK